MTEYNPSIQSLLAECEKDWGDPQVNRQSLVPYGIMPIDMALYGIDVVDGELVIIQGEEKNRKTTLAENVIANVMTGSKPVVKPPINIESLESGMPPGKYRDALISIMASRYLLLHGHRSGEFCPACNAGACTLLKFSPKFLRYNTRTQEQLDAVDYAMDAMNGWPLYIHGAHVRKGDTRNLRTAAKGKDSRWQYLLDEYGIKIFVIDHVQQYQYDDEPTEYEKQVRAVSTVGDFVSQHSVAALLLSQVSLTSVREARSGTGRIIAAGGAKAAQEANTVISTKYESGANVMTIKIEESRYAGSFSVWQRLEPTSGSFYGEPSTEPI